MGINGETINMSREHSGCQHGFNALLFVVFGVK